LNVDVDVNLNLNATVDFVVDECRSSAERNLRTRDPRDGARSHGRSVLARDVPGHDVEVNVEV
jgi:hypothetical protein